MKGKPGQKESGRGRKIRRRKDSGRSSRMAVRAVWEDTVTAVAVEAVTARRAISCDVRVKDGRRCQSWKLLWKPLQIVFWLLVVQFR